MGNMKANRKFIDGEEAVSAVIGVILMVAITVAIAATVYVYVSGMLTPTTTGKTMQATLVSTDATSNNTTWKVTSADSGIPWSKVNASWSNASGGYGTATLWPPSGEAYVQVGQIFSVSLTCDGGCDPESATIDLIYNNKIIWTSSTVDLGG